MLGDWLLKMLETTQAQKQEASAQITAPQSCALRWEILSATARDSEFEGAYCFAEVLFSKSARKPIPSKAGLISAFDINSFQMRPVR